jgi:CBS domain-containing protein
MVTLPSSPGTSGFPVVDLNGNLVGIIVNGAT